MKTKAKLLKKFARKKGMKIKDFKAPGLLFDDASPCPADMLLSAYQLSLGGGRMLTRKEEA